MPDHRQGAGGWKSYRLPKDWEHIGEPIADGMFDRAGITSGIFHKPDHCNCRQKRELRWSGLEEGNKSACLGQAKAPTQVAVSTSRWWATSG